MLNPSLNMTIVQGEISLKSSFTNRNPLTVSAFETVTPEITIYPTNIQLPVGPLPRSSISHVTIRENITNITVSDPVFSAPGVEVSISAVKTNRTYLLSVVFPQKFEARAGQNLIVKTDNPRFPTITVPVTPMPGLTQNLPMFGPGATPAARVTPAPAPRSNTPQP